MNFLAQLARLWGRCGDEAAASPQGTAGLDLSWIAKRGQGINPRPMLSGLTLGGLFDPSKGVDGGVQGVEGV